MTTTIAQQRRRRREKELAAYQALTEAISDALTENGLKKRVDLKNFVNAIGAGLLDRDHDVAHVRDIEQ